MNFWIFTHLSNAKEKTTPQIIASFQNELSANQRFQILSLLGNYII